MPSHNACVSDGSTVYELVFREASARNRSRFNAISLNLVPEPSGIVLSGLGLLTLAFRRRR